MKNALLYLFLMFLSIQVYSQFCTQNNRFTEVDFFTEAQVQEDLNVVYATVNGEDLAMDIYYPSSAADTLPSRPFILVFHGGSFISGNRQMLASTCLEFAKKGFVAATVSYRLSDQPDVPAQYKAAQDGHAAMRYIVHHAATYNINTDWLFIGGGSAGSINCFAMVYIDQQEWQNRDQVNDLMTDYGPLYSNGNSLTDTYEIQGIFNNWGSAYVLAFDVNEAIPAISFHGGQDNVVDIDLNTTTLTGGSNVIHSRLTENNICSDLTVDSLGNHGIYKGQKGTIFRVSKASCFFKSIFCNTCTTVSTFDSIPATCSSISSTTAFVEDKKEPIEIFPNPVRETFRLSDTEELQQVEILTLEGKMLKTFRLIQSSQEFDLANLPAGLYFVKATFFGQHKVVMSKIVKE